MSSILDALKKLEADRSQPEASPEHDADSAEAFDVADAEAALFGKRTGKGIPKPLLLVGGGVLVFGTVITLSVLLSLVIVGRMQSGNGTQAATVQSASLAPDALGAPAESSPRAVAPDDPVSEPATATEPPLAEVAPAVADAEPIATPAPAQAHPEPQPAAVEAELPPQPTPPVQKPIVIAKAAAPVPAAREEPVDSAPAAVPAPIPMPPPVAREAAPAPQAVSPPETAPPVSTALDDLELPASPLATPSSTELAANRIEDVTPMPKNAEELPVLRGSDRIRHDLENFRINVVRASQPNNPYAHAVINLHKVFIGERIPATSATLVAVTQTGVGIEIIGTGERFFVRQ
jgi:hypothetical protein